MSYKKDTRMERAKDFWRRFKKNKPAVGGLFILLLLILVTVFADFLTPYDPWESRFEDKLQPPSWRHVMGTDNFGRDVMSRIIFGSRISILIGFSAAAITIFVGVVVGSVAGYFGGLIDNLVMRVTELFMVIPTFFLILLIVAVFGGSVWNVIVVIGITSWPGTARVIRASFLSLKEKEFVEAARLVGSGNFRIIFKHILPNAMGPLIVLTSLRVASSILAEAGLSFLGLGDINFVTWGQLLYKAQIYMRISWWSAVFPGLMIFMAVLAFNLIGDGLTDALNPRLKER
jgi:peptide/nickel transport system permease protein